MLFANLDMFNQCRALRAFVSPEQQQKKEGFGDLTEISLGLSKNTALRPNGRGLGSMHVFNDDIW